MILPIKDTNFEVLLVNHIFQIQNSGSLLMKSSQSNFNLRSPNCYLIRSYQIATVKDCPCVETRFNSALWHINTHLFLRFLIVHHFINLDVAIICSNVNFLGGMDSCFGTSFPIGLSLEVSKLKVNYNITCIFCLCKLMRRFVLWYIFLILFPTWT